MQDSKTPPRAATLSKIAKLYGCTVDELLRKEGNKWNN
jgi:arsenate reductase-like glutaredoxin family protein